MLRVLLLLLLTFSPIMSESTADLFQKMFDDMMLPNEAPLLNPPTGPSWVHRGSIAQGGVPRGDACPPWWKPADSLNLKSSDYWNAASLWFVFYPGANHKAGNVRFAADSLEMYLLVATDAEKTIENAQWIQVQKDNLRPSWAGYYGHHLIENKGNATPRTEASGAISYGAHPDSTWPIHAGLDKFEIEGDKVLNLMVRMKAYLVADDTSKPFTPSEVEYMVNLGVDYYPSIQSTISDFAPTGYNPGVGLSSFRLLSTTPQWFHMVAMDPPGYTDIPVSEFEKNGGILTLTEAQLRQNPPPPYQSISPVSSLPVVSKEQVQLTYHGTTLSLSLPSHLSATVVIADSRGRIMSTSALVGGKEWTQSTSSFAQGVYFYKVEGVGVWGSGKLQITP